jgi:hypothetical protein
VINTLTGIHQIVLFCFVFTLSIFHQWYQSLYGGRREKKEKYGKRFSEKSSEEKNILTVENFLSDVT